ncbi:MAG: BspA family leucine-rich repeat surface protein [Spirochaetales bacterium]|nr:BspA family leucine-rich repeat surface protein [Spirochaetales bacterium]
MKRLLIALFGLMLFFSCSDLGVSGTDESTSTTNTNDTTEEEVELITIDSFDMDDYKSPTLFDSSTYEGETGTFGEDSTLLSVSSSTTSKSIDLTDAQSNADYFYILLYNESWYSYIKEEDLTTACSSSVELPAGEYRVMMIVTDYEYSDTYGAQEYMVGSTEPVTVVLEEGDYNTVDLGTINVPEITYSAPETVTEGDSVTIEMSGDLKNTCLYIATWDDNAEFGASLTGYSLDDSAYTDSYSYIADNLNLYDDGTWDYSYAGTPDDDTSYEELTYLLYGGKLDIMDDHFTDSDVYLDSSEIFAADDDSRGLSNYNAVSSIPSSDIPDYIVEDIEGTIAVEEVSTDGAFITVWTTDNEDTYPNAIMLPLVEDGEYDFTVDWGDGSSSDITEWNQDEIWHDYDDAGTYTVSIEGVLEGWSFYYSESNGNNTIEYEDNSDKLDEISNWGCFSFLNTGFYFMDCQNLTISATDIPDTSETTSFYGTFYGCSSIDTIPNMEQWDVSVVTNFQKMFLGATSFNQDISSWDVSAGTDFGFMFANATSFNQDISSWDVSAGTDFNYMFYNATAFNQDISSWDVSSGTNFYRMFYNATSFNQDISSWDVSAGTTFSYMFYNATSFNGDISSWDVSTGTYFSCMFGYATSFNQDISSWDVSSGTNFYRMFYNATSFNQDISSWDVSAGTSFYGMFDGATSFNQDISSWDVSAGTNFSYMFNNATSFNQDISSWDVSAGTYFTAMFASATSFNQDISSWDVSAGTDFSSTFYNATSFNQDISSWDVSAGTSFGYMFYNATSFNQDISSWDVSAGKHFGAMFYNATAFNQDISSWDVSAGKYFGDMFYNATSFNQDISSWDVSAGTDFSYMFRSATSFNQDISSWDLNAGTDFSYMFYNATAFNQDISSWDVSSGTNFYRMFHNATSFNQDISSWDVSAGTNFSYMFNNAESYSNGNNSEGLENWDVQDTATISSMFSNSAVDPTPSWYE